MRSSTEYVNDNDDDLISGFDAYTYSGNSAYDIFDNEDGIVTDDLNVWVNTNKNWEGGVIKIPSGDLSNYSND